ncbi:MAG: RluA family pseudouridine synthase [Lachnospiraceae bacterium]|nr:RluA family pseudouridine synthase [Lachnospiraceae bacterium]
MREFQVCPGDEGQTVYKYVCKILSDAPSSVIRKALRKKNIDLNGHRTDGSESLQKGDLVRIWFSEETFQKFAPCRGKSGPSERVVSQNDLSQFRSNIIFEDENILLINKPAGLLTQEDGSASICLNDILREYAGDRGGTVRPSACNRLDRNTSGLVICGLTVKGLQRMSEILKDRSLHKYYRALVFGTMQEAVRLKGYLIKDRKNNEVHIVAHSLDKDALPIETELVPDRNFQVKGIACSSLKVLLVTGRPHQIRAHLQSIGHPIIGDPKYFTEESRLAGRRLGVKRQLLHSETLIMPEMSGEFAALSGRTFRAELPRDMAKIMGER